MKRAKLFSTLLCAASLIVGSVFSSVPAKADSMKVVTLGADLTDEQKNTMLKYFKVSSDEVQIITVTNKDERDHLSAYVPLEQIGTRTVSCAYVKPTTSGGIKVRTANLNWVTCNMIATSLSTSGVKNCEVVAACPFQVSGTGALTGIQMAYETASGEELDETKKQIATEEMVVTGNLADDIGQNSATAVINQAKTQIIADNIQDADEIYNIVVNIADQNGVAISDDQISTIVSLLQEIAQQDYDYEDMAETLERVNDNVTGQTDSTDTETETDSEDSILDDVDDSVLGGDVIEDSTQDPTLAQQTGDDGFTEDISEETTGDDGSTENTDVDVIENTDTDVSENTDSAEEGVNGDAVNADTLTEDGTVQDIDEVSTDFLTDDAKALFEQAKTFCKGEYEDDEDSLKEAMGEEASLEVILDEETGKELYNTVLSKYLEILGNGTGSYVPTGEEKYLTTELNILEEDLKTIFGIDLTDEEKAAEGADILGDKVSSDDKSTLFKDTMKFFEKLYNETTEEYTGGTSADASTDTGAEADTTADTTAEEESYEETETYEETDPSGDMSETEGGDEVIDETIVE